MNDEKKEEASSSTTVAGSKRPAVVDLTHEEDDTAAAEPNVPKKAKAVAEETATTTNTTTFQGTLPMTPKPNYTLSFVGGTTPTNCVLYMAIAERTDSGFTRGLQHLAKICPPNVQHHCFQRDQTRHITMWQGFLTEAQVGHLSFRGDDDGPGVFQPLRINLTGWKPWKSGGYLAVHPSSVRQLKALVDRIDGLPSGKCSCDHLSLYRKREYPGGWPPFDKLRNATVGHPWGSVTGVSIRLKMLGTPYDECIVVAQAPPEE